MFFISSKLSQRFCERTRLKEACATRLVRDHTFMAVPKVYCRFTRRDLVYIFKEQLSVKLLSKNWVFQFDESKATILA